MNTCTLAFPRIAADDDTYRGYSIPKGATVIANSWFGFPPES